MIERSSLEVLIDEHGWKKDSQLLAIKLAQHLHTLHGTTAMAALNHERLNINFVDFCSVSILVRAALETFIVYAYIYGVDDASLAEFRHHTWEMAGLLDRQGMAPNDQANIEQLRTERERIDELAQMIEKSPHIQAFGKDAKRLYKGEWRAGKSWQSLGIDAGLDEKWIKQVYTHLSNHAHTSYLSILQISQASPSHEDQQWLADVSISMGLEIMAHFAAMFATKRRGAAAYLKENAEANRLIKFWRLTADDYRKARNVMFENRAYTDWKLNEASRTRTASYSVESASIVDSTLKWTQ
jgi:hypothetical protein